MEDAKPKHIDVAKEIETLVSAVEKAAQARQGTFSQRNPLLGKMKTCPYCRRRRRANAQEPCCNPKYVKEHEAGPKIKRRRNPRLSRNNPPLFLMRQILLQLEEEPLLIGPLQDSAEGLKGFWTPQNEVRMEHLATFVEKVILRNRKKKAKQKRDRQKQSRKVNRG